METYKAFKNDLFVFVIFYFVITAVFNYFEFQYDSTDGKERSGMSLHTDNLTGCQYLGKFNYLTPRLNSAGGHMCVGIK